MLIVCAACIGGVGRVASQEGDADACCIGSGKLKHGGW